MQSRRKETKDALETRLVSYIKGRGRYVTLAELRRDLHLSDKLLYSRGLSCPELNLKAGVIGQLPDNTKSKEEIEVAYMELLKTNRSIRMHEAARVIGVSVEYMEKLGIRAGDLRKRVGLANCTSKTRDEVETLVVTWLKTQPCYRSAQDICRALHIDFKCAIQNNGLSISELNALAGHSRIAGSYHEELAVSLCQAAGLMVERQKTFPGCVDKSKLRYDIWLPEYSTLIEINGEQHYQPRYPTYEGQKRRDAIKATFAAQHNMPLFIVDIAPKNTFETRLRSVIQQIKGSPLVTED